MLLNRPALTIPLLALLLLPCSASASQVRSDQVEDIANIDFRVDLRIFTVMAAINAAGFDYEASGEEMSPVRQQVRKTLQSLDPGLLQALQRYYATHRFPDALAAHTAYTSLALVIGSPPTFEVREDSPRLPADVMGILDFNQLLALFYEKAGVEELWANHSSSYTTELQRYRPVVRKVVRDTLDYFRIPARIVLDRQIVLIPDLLGYQDVVHARNMEKVYYIVVGPAQDPASNYEQLQHEYLHFLVDPLVEKYGGILLTTQGLLPMAQQQPGLSSDFRDQYLLIVGESLIEALLWRLHPPEDPETKMVSLFRKGLVLLPYFVSALETFEKISDRPLPVHLEDIFAGISESEVEKEAERILAIENTREKERQDREDSLSRERAAYAERERKRQLLDSATASLRTQEFAQAKQYLAELLELDAGNPHALFYLAQIAAQEGAHEEAFAYYSEVTASPGVEPWIVATARVRMGRYLAYQRQFEKAREQFLEVLTLAGDLEGAREEAESALKLLEEQ